MKVIGDIIDIKVYGGENKKKEKNKVLTWILLPKLVHCLEAYTAYQLPFIPKEYIREQNENQNSFHHSPHAPLTHSTNKLS